MMLAPVYIGTVDRDMATITNPRLVVTTDRSHDAATVVVSCDIAFTTFEVTSMNELRLRYSLRCDLLDMDLLYPDTVVRFEEVQLPRREARQIEHVEFTSDAKMSSMHMYALGKDPLCGRLVLTNCETGAEVVAHSPTVLVDLAA